MVAASFIVLGFIATFVPQFLLGNTGDAARGFYVCEDAPRPWNVASTAGDVTAGVRLPHHRPCT